MDPALLQRAEVAELQRDEALLIPPDLDYSILQVQMHAAGYFTNSALESGISCCMGGPHGSLEASGSLCVGCTHAFLLL